MSDANSHMSAIYYFGHIHMSAIIFPYVRLILLQTLEDLRSGF
jgi:hypothetical protein